MKKIKIKILQRKFHLIIVTREIQRKEIVAVNSLKKCVPKNIKKKNLVNNCNTKLWPKDFR